MGRAQSEAGGVRTTCEDLACGRGLSCGGEYHMYACRGRGKGKDGGVGPSQGRRGGRKGRREGIITELEQCGSRLEVVYGGCDHRRGEALRVEPAYQDPFVPVVQWAGDVMAPFPSAEISEIHDDPPSKRSRGVISTVSLTKGGYNQLAPRREGCARSGARGLAGAKKNDLIKFDP